ncbi:hypothetical protein AOLI_G00134230 [Acnodon oligacanthus]
MPCWPSHSQEAFHYSNRGRCPNTPIEDTATPLTVSCSAALCKTVRGVWHKKRTLEVKSCLMHDWPPPPLNLTRLGRANTDPRLGLSHSDMADVAQQSVADWKEGDEHGHAAKHRIKRGHQ